MSRRGRREAGFSLVGALAGITIMLTLMGMAMPAWKYVMQDDREEELLFRGTQIVEAIERYQKEKRALPISLDMLVKAKYLRKPYKDPMTKDGKWRFLGQGEVGPRGARPGVPGSAGRPGRPEGNPAFRPIDPLNTGGTTVGPFVGVVSTSTAKSLRLFNGRSRYDEWIFAVGVPRFVGKPPVNLPPGGFPASPRPGAGPTKPR